MNQLVLLYDDDALSEKEDLPHHQIPPKHTTPYSKYHTHISPQNSKESFERNNHKYQAN